MVILYAARHRLPVPRLARWMLALGVAASLAVNVAQGWSHGLVGAVVAAWPAVALVGSYELLAWMIRTAAGGGPDRGLVADQGLPNAGQPVTRSRPSASLPREVGSLAVSGYDGSGVSDRVAGLLPVARAVSQERSPSLQGQGLVERAGQAGQPVLNASSGGDQASRCRPPGPVSAGTSRGDIDAAAVATYRASVQEGAPLSERKLAEAFGSTSRRWARNRIAEAWKNPAPG